MLIASVPAFDRLNDPAPHARLLSNGTYSVLLTSAGSGYSWWRDTALNGWWADRTEDADGVFLYLRDAEDGVLWSAAHQPCTDGAERYAAHAAAGVITLERRQHGIESRLEVAVAADADVEVRRLTLRNDSAQPRRIEVTSGLEVVLNQSAAHAAHPAFSKLFVQTELDPALGALLARRRPRSAGEQPPWMGHVLLGPGALQHETDRARFRGRNRTPADPQGLHAALSGTVGSVLDPLFSLRRTVELPAGGSATVVLLLAAAPDGTALRGILQRASAAGYADGVLANPARPASSLDAAQNDATLELAGALLYGHPALRGPTEVIRRAHGAAAQLWQYALGGGPFAALHAQAPADTPRAAALLQAREVWRAHGLRVDVAIVCGAGAELTKIRALAEAAAAGGTIFVRPEAELGEGDLDVLLASANLVVGAQAPDLNIANGIAGGRRSPAAGGGRAGSSPAVQTLQFDNTYGGFSSDGREYVIRVTPDSRPPAAWINVVANPACGFLASESGAGYTWSQNSREHRLTPWGNDPVADPHGEALYLRDDESGVFWSPQPGPCPDAQPYEARHGFGYSVWHHTSQELEQEVLQFVPAEDAVKITRVRITNRGTRPRRLSLFAYQRLVLGVLPAESGRLVVTAAADGILRAHHRINGEFSGGEAFAAAVTAAGLATPEFTTDRTAFIGRHGSPLAPAAVASRTPLDGVAGTGLDPCFALHLGLDIAPGATVTCAVLLGEVADPPALVRRYASLAAVDAALATVRAEWDAILGAVQVETPAPAIDLMLNGWLLYQVIACRLWGRSALYQSGGAYGFRDQLQDAAALLYTRPDLTRAQILMHAAHQFVEGDVLHWWHPPLSRGIRTRFSDDLLWLPFVTALYLRATGDHAVLDESAAFLTAPALTEGQDENYLLPTASGTSADLFDHCCRAIDRSLTRGAHGLPLMGTGDWNDGMNRVGREGRGESVWVGFFLYDVLGEFIPLCQQRGDAARAARYSAYRSDLLAAVNDGGWDGAWYRRAYYDDGAPLGSASNQECRIDAIAQAWSVISGAAPPERARLALQAAEEQLIVRDAGLIRLLTPPFDRDPHDPGYIKGYVPGIRENGGQYTHGAMWVVDAFARSGRRDSAAALLEMLSPASHSADAARAERYVVEPYVIVADIYGVAPHVGRGGWTWYTGSAGWMYRIGLESVLGVRVEGGDTLLVKPCIPDDWPEFTVRLRLAGGHIQYDLTVRNPTGCSAAVRSVTVDGAPGAVSDGTARVALQRDGTLHTVEVILGT